MALRDEIYTHDKKKEEKKRIYLNKRDFTQLIPAINIHTETSTEKTKKKMEKSMKWNLNVRREISQLVGINLFVKWTIMCLKCKGPQFSGCDDDNDDDCVTYCTVIYSMLWCE